jgi:hypothetical protein
MSASDDGADIECLGCGARFADWRDLARGDRHAEGCERPGEVFR